MGPAAAKGRVLDLPAGHSYRLLRVGMTLSKQRKVYLAVLGLGLLSLGADRLFLGGGQTAPEQATASVIVAPSRSQPSAPAKTVGGEAPAVITRVNALAERLAMVSSRQNVDPQAVPDAFELSPEWKAALHPPDGTDGTSKRIASFQQTHHLTSVVMDKVGGSAIINDNVVRVGQELDGFKLVSVSRDLAALESGSLRVELKLATESAPQAQR